MAPTKLADSDDQLQRESVEEMIADEMLVEEISIDGMCGVY